MSLSDQSRIAWRKSSHSSTNGGNCVEVAAISHEIAVRDSKNPNGPRLVISHAAFRRFASAIQNGRHDL
jgi:hypothetical protein